MSARERAGRAAGLAEQRHAYYCVLHDDPNFIRDLHILFEALFRAFSKPLTPQQRLDAIRASDARGTTPDDDARVRAFLQRWSLPPAYAFEVWSCLYAAQYGQPLRLQAVNGYLATPIAISPIRASVDPFIYNPALDPHAEAKRVTAKLRDQLRERMETQRQRAIEQGWRPVPVRRRNRSQNKAMARRLYRRAVLGWLWQQIADAEGPGITPRAVEVSAREWAKQLGVPLRASLRGRPKIKK